MGLSWSYVYVAPRSSVDELLGALARRITHGGRLRHALPWHPQTGDAFGIAGLDGDNYHEMALAVPLDDELTRAGVPVNDGVARVGLVHASFEAGASFARLRLNAATRTISSLLVDSPSIVAAVAAIAVEGEALAMFFDLEDDHTWTRIYPTIRASAPRPPYRRRTTPAEVDEDCARALELAGIPRGWREALVAVDRAVAKARAAAARHGHQLVAGDRGPQAPSPSSYEYFLARYEQLAWRDGDRTLLDVWSEERRDEVYNVSDDPMTMQISSTHAMDVRTRIVDEYPLHALGDPDAVAERFGAWLEARVDELVAALS